MPTTENNQNESPADISRDGKLIALDIIANRLAEEIDAITDWEPGGGRFPAPVERSPGLVRALAIVNDVRGSIRTGRRLPEETCDVCGPCRRQAEETRRQQAEEAGQ